MEWGILQENQPSGSGPADPTRESSSWRALWSGQARRRVCDHRFRWDTRSRARLLRMFQEAAVSRPIAPIPTLSSHEYRTPNRCDIPSAQDIPNAVLCFETLCLRVLSIYLTSHGQHWLEEDTGSLPCVLAHDSRMATSPNAETKWERSSTVKHKGRLRGVVSCLSVPGDQYAS